MKKLIYLVAIVTSIIIGCSDNLLEENVSVLSTEHYQTLEGLENGVRGAYSYVRRVYGSGGGQNAPYILFYAGTDLAMGGRWAWPDEVTYNPNFDARSEAVRYMWQGLYEGINATNTILANATEIVDGGQEKDQMVAEVRFLRGFFYFR